MTPQSLKSLISGNSNSRGLTSSTFPEKAENNSYSLLAFPRVFLIPLWSDPCLAE